MRRETPPEMLRRGFRGRPEAGTPLVIPSTRRRPAHAVSGGWPDAGGGAAGPGQRPETRLAARAIHEVVAAPSDSARSAAW